MSRDGKGDMADNGQRSLPLALASPILANAAYIVEISGFSIILAAFAATSGGSNPDAIWLYSAYSVVVSVAIVAGGWIGDRFNARLTFALGLVLFVVGGTAFFFAATFYMLILARLIQGIGGGLFSPLVPVLLIAGSPSKDSRILSNWAIISGIVAAAAPLLFTVISEAAGWRTASLLIPAIALLALACAHTLPNIAVASGQREIPRRPVFWALVAHVFCVYGLTTYFLYVAPLQAIGLGISGLKVGAAMSTLWIAFALGSSLIRKYDADAYLPLYLVLGVALDLLGISAFTLFPSTSTLFAAAVLIGLGMAFSNVPTTVLLLRLAPSQSKGIASSIDIVAARLGGFVTVSVLGTLPAFALAGAVVLSLFAVVLLVPLISVLRSGYRQRVSP